MKKTLKRVLCLVSILAFLLSLLSTAYAAANNSDVSASIDCSFSEEENAKAVFEGLSPEAKQIFLEHISYDPALVQFHREYVDATFSPEGFLASCSTNNITSNDNDPLTIVHNGLIALGLSTAVVYAFEGIASGIVAAAVDGFLPVGDIYATIVATYAAATLAVYWTTEVVPNWDGIVAVFQSAFSAMSENIAEALGLLADDASSMTNPAQSVAISGDLVIVQRSDGTIDRLRVNTRIENCYLEDNEYYVAAFINRVLMVCPINIDFGTAVAIKEANLSTVGVATYHHMLAQSVVTVNNPYGFIYHSNESHSGNPNYLPHYHPRNPNGTPKSVHIWFAF